MRFAHNRPEPLDATRVHPEAYVAARTLLKKAGVTDAALRALAVRGGGLDARTVLAIRDAAASTTPPVPGLVELLVDPCLAGDPRAGLAPPVDLRSAPPQRLADVRVGQRFPRAVVRNVVSFQSVPMIPIWKRVRILRF